MFFAAWYFIFRLIFFAGLSKYIQKTGQGKELQEKLAKSLFFKELIVILILGQMEFVISAKISFEYSSFGTGGEAIGWFTALMTLVGVLVGLPYFFVQLNKNKEDVYNPEFSAKYGVIHVFLRTNSAPRLFYYLVFTGRRVLFLLLAFSMQGSPYF